MATRKGSDDAVEPDVAPSSTARRKGPSRRGRIPITAFVDVQTHQQFRILSIEQRRSGQLMLIEAVNDLFHKYGKKPSAQ